MGLDVKPDLALKFLYEIAMGLVKDGKVEGVQDFTLRQLAILLALHADRRPQTVRGLAKRLGVSKPVITRAVASMGKQAMVARRRDDHDRRSVMIQCTAKGTVYVEALGAMIAAKGRSLG